MDASSDRDFAASFVYACALAMVHLSRIAEDFILMTSEEFGFFELADRSATGSSMMPQKKNPDPLELVRGKAGRAIGHLTGLLVDDERTAHRLQQGSAGGQGTGLRQRRDAAVSLVATRVGHRSADATRRAHADWPHRDCCWPPTSRTIWSPAGSRFARRTKSSAASCGTLLETGREFEASPSPNGVRFSPHFGDDVRAAVTPEASVGARKTPQSTAPEAVRAALAETRHWCLAAHVVSEAWVFLVAVPVRRCYTILTSRPEFHPNSRF